MVVFPEKRVFFTWSWNCISMCAYILGVLRDWTNMVFAKERKKEINRLSLQFEFVALLSESLHCRMPWRFFLV